MPDARPLKAVLFDLGGTLYRPNFDVSRLTRRFLDELGIDLHQKYTDDELSQIVATVSDRWLDEYMVSENVHKYWEPTDEIWVEYDKRFLSGIGLVDDLDNLTHRYRLLWSRYTEEARPKILDGVREGLETLNSYGCRMSIASNRFGNPSRFLEADEIDRFFENVEYTAVPGYSKPSPYMLLNVAQKMGVNPRLCAYVGNSVTYDVTAARAADMQPVLLTWVGPNEASPVSEGTVIANHMTDVVDLFQRRSRGG